MVVPKICVLCLSTLSLLALTTRASANALLISQTSKGRAFGTGYSNDISTSIAIDSSGNIFIAGHTSPVKEGDAAWGEVEAGGLSGSSDIFLAKLSELGDLQWVKRAGSKRAEHVKDMKVGRGAVYICGSTEGNMGSPAEGLADVFVVKFSLDGDKGWQKPYQFGSAGNDTCNSLAISETSNAVYIGGSTSGRLFGDILPEDGAMHSFVAKLTEDEDKFNGLELVKGRQYGGFGSSSTDAIALAKNRLYVLATNWKGDERTREDSHYRQVSTGLSLYDEDAFILHKTYGIQADIEGGFRGMRMSTVNQTGEAFIAGQSYSVSHAAKDGFSVVKFSLPAESKGSTGGIQWVKHLGKPGYESIMRYQMPSVVADTGNGLVYIAGISDGFFKDKNNNDTEQSGLMSVPFFKLSASTGECMQRWHRTTNVPVGTEELTDLALDARNSVVYTGVWYGGDTPLDNALVGSFGSPRHSSRTAAWTPLTTNGGVQSSAVVVPEEERTSFEVGRFVGVLIGIVGAGIIVLSALIVTNGRSSGRKVDLESAYFAGDMVQLRQQDVEARAEAARQSESLVPGSGIVGGSAGPQ